ncbi:hypothetical protein BC567DRAFT_226186 [Phyllosticta citribraziliensis]
MDIEADGGGRSQAWDLDLGQPRTEGREGDHSGLQLPVLDAAGVQRETEDPKAHGRVPCHGLPIGSVNGHHQRTKIGIVWQAMRGAAASGTRGTRAKKNLRSGSTRWQSFGPGTVRQPDVSRKHRRSQSRTTTPGRTASLFAAGRFACVQLPCHGAHEAAGPKGKANMRVEAEVERQLSVKSERRG